MAAELQEARVAREGPRDSPQVEPDAVPEWVRTLPLDDELIPVEDMRCFKRLRAALNFGQDTAAANDLDCLTQEEQDRLESIETQVRWDQHLRRPEGTDVRPGRHFPWPHLPRKPSASNAIEKRVALEAAPRGPASGKCPEVLSQGGKIDTREIGRTFSPRFEVRIPQKESPET